MEVLRYQKAQVRSVCHSIHLTLFYFNDFYSVQANQGNKKDLQKQLEEDIAESKPVKDIISSVKEAVIKYHLQEHEIITSVYTHSSLNGKSIDLWFAI